MPTRETARRNEAGGPSRLESLGGRDREAIPTFQIGRAAAQMRGKVATHGDHGTGLIRRAPRSESPVTRAGTAAGGEANEETAMGANAKLIQEAYDAFGRGDVGVVIGMLDANVEWVSPRSLPHGGEFSGPAQVGKFFEGIGAAWDSLTLDIESVDEAGNNVFAVLRADGTLKSGEARTYGAAHVFEIRDGKIVRWREYVNQI